MPNRQQEILRLDFSRTDSRDERVLMKSIYEFGSRNWSNDELVFGKNLVKMSEGDLEGRRPFAPQDYQVGFPSYVNNYNSYAGPIHQISYNCNQLPSYQAYNQNSVTQCPPYTSTGSQHISAPHVDYHESELHAQLHSTVDTNDQLLQGPFAANASAGQQNSPSTRGGGFDFQRYQLHHPQHTQQSYNQVNYYVDPAPISHQQQQASDSHYIDNYFQPNSVAVGSSYHHYPTTTEYSIKYKQQHNGNQAQPQPQLHYPPFPPVCPPTRSEPPPVEPAGGFGDGTKALPCHLSDGDINSSSMPPAFKPDLDSSGSSSAQLDSTISAVDPKSNGQPPQSDRNSATYTGAFMYQQQPRARHQKQLPCPVSTGSIHEWAKCETASYDVARASCAARRLAVERVAAHNQPAGGALEPPNETSDAGATRVRSQLSRRSSGTVKKITKDGVVIARRKNATREITAILKCWLELNIGNPYPNKCEKGVLSCASSMTGTQVSTWFANARRRMKKEEKLPQRQYRGPKSSEVRLASAIATRSLDKLNETCENSSSQDPAAAAANASLLTRLKKFVDQLNKLAEDKRKEEQVGSSSIISSSSSSSCPTNNSPPSNSSSSLNSSASALSSSPSPAQSPEVKPSRIPPQHSQQPSSTTRSMGLQPGAGSF